MTIHGSQSLARKQATKASDSPGPAVPSSAPQRSPRRHGGHRDRFLRALRVSVVRIPGLPVAGRLETAKTTSTTTRTRFVGHFVAGMSRSCQGMNDPFHGMVQSCHGGNDSRLGWDHPRQGGYGLRRSRGEPRQGRCGPCPGRCGPCPGGCGPCLGRCSPCQGGSGPRPGRNGLRQGGGGLCRSGGGQRGGSEPPGEACGPTASGCHQACARCSEKNRPEGVVGTAQPTGYMS